MEIQQESYLKLALKPVRNKKTSFFAVPYFFFGCGRFCEDMSFVISLGSHSVFLSLGGSANTETLHFHRIATQGPSIDVFGTLFGEREAVRSVTRRLLRACFLHLGRFVLWSVRVPRLALLSLGFIF